MSRIDLHWKEKTWGKVTYKIGVPFHSLLGVKLFSVNPHNLLIRFIISLHLRLRKLHYCCPLDKSRGKLIQARVGERCPHLPPLGPSGQFALDEVTPSRPLVRTPSWLTYPYPSSLSFEFG